MFFAKVVLLVSSLSTGSMLVLMAQEQARHPSSATSENASVGKPTPTPSPSPPVIKSASCHPGDDVEGSRSASSTEFTLTSELRPTLAHVFTQEQAFQTTPETLVVIAHGSISLGQGYREQTSYFEIVPVFVSARRHLGQLSKAQVIGILSGTITDWAQLGEAKGPIDLYLHGGTLQQKSFEVFVETLGIARADLRSPNLRYGPDYESLKRVSAEDINAVVFGLRELEPQGLKLVAIEGASVLDPATWDAYPLRLKIHIYRKDSAEALRLYDTFMKETEKRNTLRRYAASVK